MAARPEFAHCIKAREGHTNPRDRVTKATAPSTAA